MKNQDLHFSPRQCFTHFSFVLGCHGHCNTSKNYLSVSLNYKWCWFHTIFYGKWPQRYTMISAITPPFFAIDKHNAPFFSSLYHSLEYLYLYYFFGHFQSAVKSHTHTHQSTTKISTNSRGICNWWKHWDKAVIEWPFKSYFGIQPANNCTTILLVFKAFCILELWMRTYEPYFHLTNVEIEDWQDCLPCTFVRIACPLPFWS